MTFKMNLTLKLIFTTVTPSGIIVCLKFLLSTFVTIRSYYWPIIYGCEINFANPNELNIFCFKLYKLTICINGSSWTDCRRCKMFVFTSVARVWKFKNLWWVFLFASFSFRFSVITHCMLLNLIFSFQEFFFFRTFFGAIHLDSSVCNFCIRSCSKENTEHEFRYCFFFPCLNRKQLKNAYKYSAFCILFASHHLTTYSTLYMYYDLKTEF